MQFTKIAVFGANGDIGNAILHALATCEEQSFNISAIVSPSSHLKYSGETNSITVKKLDVLSATEKDFAQTLNNVEVVISALGGKLLDCQLTMQNGAAQAGVQRFYPSEFGMHQILVLPNGEHFVHPAWAQKIKCFENATRHPAVEAGLMSYTVIGCGEMFDVGEEPMLCPWLKADADEYVIHTVGNEHAKVDFCSRHDVASFLVSSICLPRLSENRVLGLRGHNTSWAEIATSLRRYTSKPVDINNIPVDLAIDWIKHPAKVPSTLQNGSSFPPDFWLLLRYVEGQGGISRSSGQFHDETFLRNGATHINGYFKELFSNALD